MWPVGAFDLSMFRMKILSSAARGVIRAANTTGRGPRRLGVETISLDERSLLEAARRETGLEDFGGDDFREPLGLVLEGWRRRRG